MCCPDQPEHENVFGWYFLIMGTNCFRYYILFWKELEQFQFKCTWFQLLWAFASQRKYCDSWTPASEWQHFTNLVRCGRKSDFGVPSHAHMLPCGCCLYIWCFTEGRDAHGLANTFVYMWKVTMLLGISITSACLTYPRLWGRCICWVPLRCDCCAGVEALVQMVHRLSCSGGIVLVWEDQSVSGLYTDEWCNTSVRMLVTPVFLQLHYCLQLWVGSADKSPQGPCGPAVPTITGLQRPHGACGCWIGDRRQPRWAMLVPHC